MLVTHTVIAHVHHKQLSESEDVSEHSTANSFLDYIKLALHTDPGSDHLEDFYGENFTFYHSPMASDLPEVKVDQSLLQLQILAPALLKEPYISQFPHTGPVTRGPPLT